MNIVTLTDSYKFTHHKVYPKNTEFVYSYFEARKGARFRSTVFFGLQYLLKKYLEGVVVTQEDIDFAAKFSEAHFGNSDIFNREGWEYILKEKDGKLPVRIKAVPEGMVVPVNNVMMTVENTDPKCFWLTNHLETLLSQVWYPSTVATLSREVKVMAKEYLRQTAETDDALPFMLHDFGYRGATTVESAGIGGAGHILNFLGTDTVRAIEVAMKYYNAEVCAYSVPATEHSVMTSLGPDREFEIFERAIEQYPEGILSIVSDSYDIFTAAEKIVGEKLKDKILDRNGVFVLRPDSGEPVPVVLKLLEILGSCFGVDKNKKGFRVLNPKVRIIWGDGLDFNKIEEILAAMKKNEWSAENIVFGMGGGLLQKVNRDFQRFAFKCSAQCRNGKWFDIYKEPKDLSKASKKGRFGLYRIWGGHGSTFKTDKEGLKEDILQTVFEDGEIKKECNFEDVRNMARVR